MAYTDATRAARAEAEQNVRIIQAEIAANAQSVTTLEQGDQRRTAAIQLVRGEMTNLVAAIEAVAGKEVALTGVRNQSTGAINLQSDASKGLVAQLYAMQDAEISAHNATVNLWMEANQAYRTLQDDMTASTLSGVDLRLFEIARERDGVIAGFQQQYAQFPGLLASMTALAQQKYGEMGNAAQTMFFQPVAMSWQEMATMAPAQFDAMAATITAAAQAMGINVVAVINTIRNAHTAATKATEEVERAAWQIKMNRDAQYLEAASTIIRSIFGRNKTAAYAGAVIDTAAAVMKALASTFPPLNYVLAAAAAAMGYAQIQTIRSQQVGFAAGTPGTSFVDFGRATPTVLHGKEAVINQQQGRSLASMLAASIQGAGTGPHLPGLAPTSGGATVLSDPELLAEMRGTNALLRRFIQAQPTVMRDAVMLAGA
jgi:hypothetical protein